MKRSLFILFLAATRLAGAEGPVVETWTLDKGTTVVLLEDHRVPLVELTVEVPVGTWSPWARQNHGEEAWEIQPHDRRARLRSRADELGVDVELEMRPWSARAEMTCGSSELVEAVGLLKQIFGNRDPDPHELERWQKTRILWWEGALKNPRFVLAQNGSRLLFAKDDPRRLRWEVPARVLTEVDQLLAARDTLIRCPGRVIAIAGDVDRVALQEALHGVLPPVSGITPAGLEPAFRPEVPATARGGDLRVPMRRLTQVYFALGRTSLTFRDERWPAFMVADHVLGGHFFSRLYVALRHTGGETYGAQTVLQGGEAAGLYALTSYTHTANADGMEARLRAVLQRFHSDGITEEERLSAVGFLEGRRLFDRESPKQVLDRVLWEMRHGYARGFRDRLVERAAALSLAEINAFIGEFYDPAGFTMIRVEQEQ